MPRDADSVLLASASPRRRRLIGWLGIPVDTTATDVDEPLDGPLADRPPLLAEQLACDKALAAAEAHGASRLTLAFDTIVVLEGALLGKPADGAEARRMLRALSGGMHDVVTGVAILEPGQAAARTFSVTTPVRMRELADETIERWLAGDEVLGCAGAYNIERHLASVGIAECFQNVAGLPLCHLYAALARGDVAGVPDGLRAPVGACDAALGRTCELGPPMCAATP